MDKTPQYANLKSFISHLEAMVSTKGSERKDFLLDPVFWKEVDIPDHIQGEIFYLLSSYWDFKLYRVNYLLANSRVDRAYSLSALPIYLPSRTLRLTVKWERKGPLAFFKRRSELVKEIRFALNDQGLSDMSGDYLDLPDGWRIRVETSDWVNHFGW